MTRTISLRDLAIASLPSKTGFKTELSKSIQAIGQANLSEGLEYCSKAWKGLTHDLLRMGFQSPHFWPENTYLVNHRYKFIYCPIPKIASTTLNNLVIGLEDKGKARKDPHIEAQAKYSLSHLSLFHAVKCLNSPNYFKFVFVRNPWARLVSAYYSKFVKPQPSDQSVFAQHVVKMIVQHDNHGIDQTTSISFKQFVEYLVRTDDQNLNEHWKPQSLFTGNTDFDFIGKIEQFSEDMEYIVKKVGIPQEYVPKNRNATPYQTSKDNLEEIDLSPKELSCLQASTIKQKELYLPYKKFYTPELRQLVFNRYKQDAESFHYTF